jgi:hypothetical protein
MTKKTKYKLKDWVLYKSIINDTLGKVTVRGINYIPNGYYGKNGTILNKENKNAD